MFFTWVWKRLICKAPPWRSSPVIPSAWSASPSWWTTLCCWPATVNSPPGAARWTARPSSSAPPASAARPPPSPWKSWPNWGSAPSCASAPPAPSSRTWTWAMWSSPPAPCASTVPACTSPRWNSRPSPTSSAPLHWSRPPRSWAPSCMWASLLLLTPSTRVRSVTTPSPAAWCNASRAPWRSGNPWACWTSKWSPPPCWPCVPARACARAWWPVS